MNVLVLATSGPRAAIGLTVDGAALRSVPLGQGADRGRGVAPAIDALLREAGLEPKDLHAIAVDVGPGSFTGTRVGVATAKGLHVALDVPVAGVSSLDAIAHATGPTGSHVLALRDARSGEAYFAVYPPLPEGDPAARAPLAPPGRGTGEEIRAAIARYAVGRVLASGEDAERLAVTLALGPVLAGVRTPFVGVEDVLGVALPRLSRGEFDPADALRPLYLQPSTPERRLAEASSPPPKLS